MITSQKKLCHQLLALNLRKTVPGVGGGGQILLCTNGRGWYQEWGQEVRELFPGDVVCISAGVKHWHGAAQNSWFSHVAFEAPGEDCSNEWLEPVDEEQYGKLR